MRHFGLLCDDVTFHSQEGIRVKIVMGHHLGVFTVTCNRKSFCFAYNGRASSELRHSLSRFSSKLQGTKEIIQVPELSPKTAAFTFFLLLTSSLWSKCTFSRLIIPFILCRYERKMCFTDEYTVFENHQKNIILQFCNIEKSILHS